MLASSPVSMVIQKTDDWKSQIESIYLQPDLAQAQAVRGRSRRPCSGGGPCVTMHRYRRNLSAEQYKNFTTTVERLRAGIMRYWNAERGVPAGDGRF